MSAGKVNPIHRKVIAWGIRAKRRQAVEQRISVVLQMYALGLVGLWVSKAVWPVIPWDLVAYVSGGFLVVYIMLFLASLMKEDARLRFREYDRRAASGEGSE